MAQPTDKILTPSQLDGADYRNQFVESVTDATDFATADSSLVLATVPFLKQGSSFDDVPLYTVGITQNFQYNEGLQGRFVPEIGSSRKVAASGTAMGTGSITRMAMHGNSLLAALYRPTIFWILSSPSLTEVIDKISGADANWINGLVSQSDQNIDLFSAELDELMNKVVAAGGMNSPLLKIPFGLVEIKRDSRQRCIAINFLEQCSLRSDQSGISAGQFQIAEAMSFDYERKRSLRGIGPFALSAEDEHGIAEKAKEE